MVWSSVVRAAVALGRLALPVTVNGSKNWFLIVEEEFVALGVRNTAAAARWSDGDAILRTAIETSPSLCPNFTKMSFTFSIFRLQRPPYYGTNNNNLHSANIFDIPCSWLDVRLFIWKMY